jgi:hypothetical protein
MLCPLRPTISTSKYSIHSKSLIIADLVCLDAKDISLLLISVINLCTLSRRMFRLNPVCFTKYVRDRMRLTEGAASQEKSVVGSKMSS